MIKLFWQAYEARIQRQFKELGISSSEEVAERPTPKGDETILQQEKC